MLRQLSALAFRSPVLECQALRWSSSSLQKKMESDGLPTIEEGRQAFEGDLRATSGLGLGAGLTSHTSKWLSEGSQIKSPMQCIQEEPPIKCHGLRVASRGGDDPDLPGLGCPIEYIDLRGTTAEKPAVCKYTGNKYYSDDWIGGGAGH